jgi:hypothetical protein
MKSHIKHVIAIAFAFSSTIVTISASAQSQPLPDREDCPQFFLSQCQDGHYLNLPMGTYQYRACSYCYRFADWANGL